MSEVLNFPKVTPVGVALINVGGETGIKELIMASFFRLFCERRRCKVK